MRYGVLFLALALALLAGCIASTKNVSPDMGPTRGPVITAAGFVTSDFLQLYGYSRAAFRVEWERGVSPFTISIDMGGGTYANVPSGTSAESPFEHVFELLNPRSADWVTYSFLVVVTDNANRTGTIDGSYTVTPIHGEPPQIVNVSYSDGALEVDVSDMANDDALVTVTVPEGLRVDATSKLIVGGNGTATFYWSPADFILGGSGVTDITVSSFEGEDADSAFILFSPVVAPSGALAAVPTVREATTDDVVTVVVIAGDFTNPFQYMNTVGVTVDYGADYASDTFNVGAPGGKQWDADGVWTTVGPDAFLLPPDFWMPGYDNGGGRVRIDFNVTPIGGSETSNGGVLFNFGLEFDHAGTYTLGFEEFHDVKRTYYSDSASTEYYWDDISNNYPGVPNSIDVGES